MALTVNTNVSALIAQINLGRSSDRLSLSLERLSTGLKINRAVDDAAGLVISEYQRAQIAGLDQAITNVDRATTFAQTAEAALGEINALLIDLRQLAIDAANTGSHDTSGLNAIQNEVDYLLGSIDRIANTSKFGNKNILDGNQGLNGFSNNPDIEFVQASDLDALAGETTAVFTVDITAEASKTTVDAPITAVISAPGESLQINGKVIELTEGMTQGDVVEAINVFSGETGFTASLTDSTTIQLEANQYGVVDLAIYSNRDDTPGSSGFGDAGMAAEIILGMGSNVVGTIANNADAGTDESAQGLGSVLTGQFGHEGSLISVETEDVTGATDAQLVLNDHAPRFHVGAFAGDSTSVRIARSSSDALGIGVGSMFASLSKIDVRTPDGAGDAQVLIDRAIIEVSSQRGTIGAFQSQNLEKVKVNLESQFTNMSDAESVLRDTDFAKEITAFTNEQIRQQAATTVLGLANQTAQQVLALLAG